MVRLIKETFSFENLVEGGTSRLYANIVKTPNWAIISTYRGERSEAENRKLLQELKQKVKRPYGFIEFISRWVEDGEAFDERSLYIPNIDKGLAMKYGKEYDQASVIVCENGKCNEICTTPFTDNDVTYRVGDIVRTFDISSDTPLNISDAEAIFSRRIGGPVSKPVKGTRPFTLKTTNEVYEVAQARPSYFHEKETTFRIY